jgi:ParB-like chromosome segregation protein Spo0J
VKILRQIRPELVIATNESEPQFQPTITSLRKLGATPPPIHALRVGEELWVVDGNQRRDVAVEVGRPIDVIVVETDADLLEVRGQAKTAYTKVTKVEQLKNILEPRLVRIK